MPPPKTNDEETEQAKNAAGKMQCKKVLGEAIADFIKKKEEATFLNGINRSVVTAKPDDKIIYSEQFKGFVKKSEPTNVILTKSHADTYIEVISSFYRCSRKYVMKDPVWNKIYMEQPVSFKMLGSTGPAADSTLPALACHNCGLLLPVLAIQVDHYIPAERDNNPAAKSLTPEEAKKRKEEKEEKKDAAVLKALRVMGLTELGPKNKSKGKPIRDAIEKLIKENGNTQAALNGIDFSPLYPKEEKSKAEVKYIVPDKWTTKLAGSAFLSVLYHKSASQLALQKACLNSLINFVPLCPLCNVSKSNSWKPRHTLPPPQPQTPQAGVGSDIAGKPSFDMLAPDVIEKLGSQPNSLFKSLAGSGRAGKQQSDMLAPDVIEKLGFLPNSISAFRFEEKPVLAPPPFTYPPSKPQVLDAARTLPQKGGVSYTSKRSAKEANNTQDFSLPDPSKKKNR